ncbi:hypothetical protein HEJ06_001898 [Campylobacter jejuni]|nr:hypothetical protein [Campylobacter jejuni]ELF7132183.1 hypothetical protein [Campylobacter jejuni]
MKLQDFDFRIWYDISECYVENPYIASFHSADKIIGGEVYHDFGKCPDFVDFDTDSLKIELFSGYCDKNGKKIYEGDIVKVEDNGNASIFKVGFSNNMGFSASLQTEAILTYQLKILASKGIEVIGNIHENADLLVVKE